MNIKDNKVQSYILCAFFAALTAVFSQIQIPLPFTPVPINLALLVPLIAGALLGPVKGALSMLVYVLLGIVGVPVFAGFEAGIGAVAGPTGGYIIGYITAAAIAGLFVSEKHYFPIMLSGFILAVLSCYTLGTVWFCIFMNMGVLKALALCVLPFIPGDALKIAGAVAISGAVRKAFPNIKSVR
ncbi:MAG: biotin transporter BioY [Clostridiales Family XIII bacterium]|jgi:biotin transport system substrate-specific component|nr:biotin transporter BioY [Clostridiales Family XIII bacterium]